MEYRDDIEQLVKNTFDNFETDVHPDAWMNIQNGLNVPASYPVSVANTVSTGAKLTAVSSKFIIMAVTAIVGITTAVIYFSSDNKTTDTNQANESKTVQSTVPVTATTDAENKNFSAAENVKKEASPVSSDEAINTKNEKQQSSSGNSVYVSSTNEDVALAEMSKKNATEVPAEKNKEAEMKLQNNPAPATPLVNEEKKAAENSLKEDEASDQSNDVNENITVPSSKEEKAIEEYLGPIVNAITPNGDGKNDVFIIEGKDLKTLRVTISDRSGKIIHQWNNLHGFWDGKLQNGEPAQTGTYFYDIFGQTNTGKLLNKKGAIHLLLQ